MSTVADEKWASRKPRFRVPAGHTIEVVVACGDGESDNRLSAELVDLSEGGAKLLASEDIPIDEMLNLTIEMPERSDELCIEASVFWSRWLGEPGWWLGCRFQNRIAGRDLDYMAGTGMLERRDHDRITTTVPATVRWELSGEPFDVVLIDYSVGGFCIVGQEEARLDHRLMLELPTIHGNVVRIPAKARWSFSGESEHRIGCEFVNRDGCTSLYAAVGAVVEDDPVYKERPLDTRVWTLLALLFLLLWFGTQALLLLFGRSLVDLGWLHLW